MGNSKSTMEIHRNWLELPRGVTLMFLNKLEAVDILELAQFVCKLWYDLCKDPSLWRTICIHGPKGSRKHGMMLKNAVDRSNGGLIALDIEGFCTDELLSYAVSCNNNCCYRSNILERLRLARCVSLSFKAVSEALKKLPWLMELELTNCGFDEGSIVPIILSCPRTLGTFRFNKLHPDNYFQFTSCDNSALAIGGSMPQLRHLQLFGNELTNVGLTAILDGCPCLQTLHLFACFQLKISGNLEKRLSQQIKDLYYCPTLLAFPNMLPESYSLLDVDSDGYDALLITFTQFPRNGMCTESM